LNLEELAFVAYPRRDQRGVNEAGTRAPPLDAVEDEAPRPSPRFEPFDPIFRGPHAEESREGFPVELIEYRSRINMGLDKASGRYIVSSPRDKGRQARPRRSPARPR
jgi:hypothetical protein